MKKLMILITLGALALGTTACHRHWGAKDPAERASKLTQLLAKKLDLSEEQRLKAQPLVQALVMERESWRGEGPKALGELKAQFQSESFDRGALEKAALAREAKLAQSRALVVQKLAEFHAILTPAQRAKAADYLGRFEQRWRERSGT